MAQRNHHEKPFHDLITRLEQELEQSRVSVEDAQAEIAALTDLNSRLQSMLSSRGNRPCRGGVARIARPR
jgi:N-methylhydantoinase B/oxoprolinase/acetone carboxylase alpha subunit